MKSLVALFAGVLIVGPVPAVTVEGNRVTLDEAEMKQCADGGGCLFIAHGDLDKLVKKFRDEAEQAASSRSRASCWSIT